MVSEIKESESLPSQSAAKSNKLYVFFCHAYSSVMYSLYEIEVPKPLPPTPDEATQADEIKNPKKLLPVLELQTGRYPDGMSCVSLGSKLYFFGGEFNMDNPYIGEDVKKNFKPSDCDVFPRQLRILDLSDVGARGDELHKLLVDGEKLRSGKARPHAFVAEEKIYVIGSTIESSISHRSKLLRIKNLESFKFFEVYDPKVDKWDVLLDPPIGNVKTRWVGHTIVRRTAFLVAWQGGKKCLYCFDLVKRTWTGASIPFYPEKFSGRTEFVEDTLYGCYRNTIAAIAPVEETKIEKEEKKGKVEGQKMEAEKVKAKETVEAEEGQGWLLKNLRLHVLSEEMGMDAIFNVPPQLQSSSSLLHLGDRKFCYVKSGMPPNSDNDSDDVIKDDRKRFISIVIFQDLGKKYKNDGTGLLQAKFHYSAHYEINSLVPNEGFINGCFFPSSVMSFMPSCSFLHNLLSIVVVNILIVN